MKKFIETVLLIILPPGNIGKSIIEVQNKAFCKAGLFSAVSLPPFIPISYLPVENCKDVFNSVISDFEYSWEISTADFINYKDSIFLKVNHAKKGQEILSKITDSQNKDTILPVYPGFFICSLKNQINTSNPEDSIQLINPPPELKFKSFSLGLLKVSYNNANPWNEVYWEIVEEKKLRKGY